ncbi:hypothetical protein AJ79_02765 [Helicocarpus griseus UAMH5409]|uniref:Uncharacterized protein n=1 Tax=Helicocarpus griseus UAMH5409 TaxID=1447875 RepID=A0A2B7Y221_9EURO|nr:hypothetical protein AJ79_02765 [Helicocarpus griseus UAMH5409]
MNTTCPYRHVSYASWRLRVFHRLAIEATGTSRNFTSSSDIQFPKPNPNQKKRHGNPKLRREQELASLETLYAELSQISEQLKNPPQLSEDSNTKAIHDEEPSGPGDVRPSEPLPKSPIIARLEERASKKHKARADQKDLDRLKYNPWARMLASPVRLCTATGARLPVKTMGEWGLVEHPETQGLFILPTDLMEQELHRAGAENRTPTAGEEESRKEAAIEEERSIEEGDETIEEDGTDFAVENDIKKAGVVKAENSTLVRPRTTFPSFYVANSAELLDAISHFKASSRHKTRAALLVPPSWKAPKGSLPWSAKYVWRKDMPVLVLAWLRERVSVRLKRARALYPLGKGLGDWTVLDVGRDGDVVGEEGLRESLKKLGDLEHAEWGAVLVTRRAGGSHARKNAIVEEEDTLSPSATSEADPKDEVSTPADSPTPPASGSEPSSVSPPHLPEYITLPSTGRLVPVFDLTTLLTGEQLEALRNHADVFQNPAIFLRPGHRAPITIFSQLWYLKNYMANHDWF